MRCMLILLLAAGCTGSGDAGVELRAGDALDHAADVFQATAEEYHDEVGQADDGREEAVTSAFVARVKTNPDRPEDVAEFLAAMRKVRQDREVEAARYTANLDNVKALREVAAGLRTIAVESMTLNDEMRRYFLSWQEAAKAAKAQAATTRQAERAQRREALSNFVGGVIQGAAPAPAGGGQ